MNPDQSSDTTPAHDPLAAGSSPQPLEQPTIEQSPSPAALTPEDIAEAVTAAEPPVQPLAGTTISPAEPTASQPPAAPSSVTPPASPAPVSAPAPTPTQTSAEETLIEETPDLPPQPPMLDKRIFTPPPEEVVKHAAKSHKKRNILIAAVVPLLLIGGTAGAYFGYVVPNKPENMWRTALVNTGKGYDKLIEYSETVQETPGWTQEGSFNIDGLFEADGTFKGESNGDTGTLQGSVSAMGAKVNFDVRTLPSATETPDMYFKVDGLEGLGTLVGGGIPEVEAALNGLNNQWYVIDHTLFEQTGAAVGDPTETITTDDVIALFKSIGVTSKEYVFTDDAEKATVVIKDTVGKETKDGRSVYHYTVDTNDKQAEKYVEALCNDFKDSKIGNMFTDSLGEDYIDCSNPKALEGDVQLKAEELTKSSEGKSTTVVDVWVDTSTKLIQTIRFSDSKDKKNYLELTQLYKGDDTMPFRVVFHDESQGSVTDIKLDATLNTKTKAFTATAEFGSVDQSNDEASMKGDFKVSMKPTTDKPKVEKPADAKNIIELLNALGFGDLLSGEGIGSLQTNSQDTTRKNTVALLSASVEESAANTQGMYPLLGEVNSKKWRTTYDIDDAIVTDPDGTSSQLVATAKKGQYGYAPTGTDGQPCNNTTVTCRKYTMTAVLSTGEVYTLDW